MIETKKEFYDRQKNLAEEKRKEIEEMIKQRRALIKQKKRNILAKLFFKYTCLPIRGKLVSMLCVVLFLAIGFCVWTYIPLINKEITKALETQTVMLAESGEQMYSLQAEKMYNSNSDKYFLSDGSMKYEYLKEMFEDMSVPEMESSYVYVVAKDGTMLYHKDQSKVGTPVVNDVIKEVVEQVKSGNVPKAEMKTYMYKGVSKVAAYKVSDFDNSIIVVTMDEDEAYESMKSIKTQTNFMILIIIALGAGIGWGFSDLISKPIKAVTSGLEELANLNVSEDIVPRYLLERTDEAGRMALAFEAVSENIRNIMIEIKDVANGLDENAKDLSDIAREVNEFSADNSATSEELSAGMEETSATTDVINGNVGEIRDNTGRISELATEGEEMADEIKGRAGEMKKTAQIADSKSKEIYASIETRTAEAIERSKSIEKINELTDAIREIASQTSLLSLNASIEAARAGESGRGFAVVASEIGSLATQSTNTVDDIAKIVTEVKGVAGNMSECLTEVLEYLRTTVFDDYSKLIEVSDHYLLDAEKFSGFMQNINNSVSDLEVTIKDVAQAIDGINTTINEATVGVTDIAKKTGDTVEVASHASELAGENVAHANKLIEFVDRFELE